MKAFIFFVGMFALGSLQAQSIVGTWQLMKQTTCLEDNIAPMDEDVSKLKEEMSGMSSRTPRTIQFKDNNTGEESVRIIDTRRQAGKSNFLYKSDNNSLYILDKKSKTIKATYTIDELSPDSLILSNTSRPCEVKVFVRIR